MDKQDIISFFNNCAGSWDDELIRNDGVIEKILDNGGVKKGASVLDVACGTGVLFPDYIKRGVNVTGIDISPEMVKNARENFPGINVICGDVEETDFAEKFDVIMIYNAFPHFPDPGKLIKKLSKLLKKGGRLSVAHGMSREALLKLHNERASAVSLPLPDEKYVATIMEPFFNVDIMISDNDMYQVSGVRR